jgi:cell division septal protein FtsQ
VLPNQIAIEISERKPVAWLAAKATEDPSIAPDSFLIDAKGVLIKMRSQLPDYLHLPVICGLPMDNFQAGATVESPELKAALDLLRLTAEKPEQFQPRTINLARGYCMVVTDQRKARITFAIEHVDLQLERLGVLLDQVEEGNHEIQTANLIVQRNTPVTFMPPPEETPAAAAAASPAPSAALKTPPLKKPEPFFKGPVRKATPVKSAASPKPVRKAVPVDAHTKTRSENG